MLRALENEVKNGKNTYNGSVTTRTYPMHIFNRLETKKAALRNCTQNVHNIINFPLH